MWWGDETMEAQVFKILDLSMDRYQGDPDQVYLTGLSMGGYGTWAFGYKYPDRFAALVPVCGGVRSRRSRVIVKSCGWSIRRRSHPPGLR